MALLQAVKGDFFGDPPRKGANQLTPKEEDREFSEDLKWAEPGLGPEELLFSEGDIPTVEDHRRTPAIPPMTAS